jgi:soluble lytic murein transglycosylase
MQPRVLVPAGAAPYHRVLMLRLAVLILVLLFPLAAAADLLSPADEKHYRAAFDAARKGKLGEAHKHAARAKDKTLAKVLDWIELTRPASGRSFGEIVAFLDRNPDWPNPHVLRMRAEDSIAALSDAELRAWFERSPPVTPFGRLRQADLLLADGKREQAIAQIRAVWIGSDFGPAEEKLVLQRYGQYLRAEDQVRRLDELAWDRNEAAVKRQYARVPDDWKSIVEARLKLAGLASDALKRLESVPAKLRNDPGLLYERARYYRRKDRYAEASEIVANAPEDMRRPTAWWTERQILSRRALQDGKAQLAYRLASKHGLVEGTVPYFEAEFLAGWIALRFLNQPAVAYDHFLRLHDTAKLPISVARGAYWAGRAAEERKEKQLAANWFVTASEHQTTYYGQLARTSLGNEAPAKLLPEPAPTPQETAAFDRKELVRAARMLHELGETDRAKTFVIRLSELAKTPSDHALAAKLAQRMGRLDLEVSIGKRASYVGVPLMLHGYPVLAMGPGGVSERPLVLAMTRQESAFDTDAISPAGARGLMQLMPTTAKEVAKNLSMPFNEKRLLTDAGYNLTLGRAYLDGLLDSFGGSYVLAIAAYNAGPSRVRQWIREFGDPRAPDVDVVDWVEMIPVNETRNYVQRVLENLQVYRVRTGDTQLAFSLSDDLRR